MRNVRHALARWVAVGALLALPVSGTWADSPDSRLPEVPKTWDEAELRAQHLPLADARVTPRPISEQQYYALTVRVIYESYPIYHPDQEPTGYQDWLKQQEPKVKSYDVARFKSDRDWIEFGREVFQFPTSSDADPLGTLITADQLRDRNWYEQVRMRWDQKTGVMPYGRYLIREKGKVEIGTLSCAMCHTRVLDDGTTILGAQGNFPFDRNIAVLMRNIAAAIGSDEQALKEFRAFDDLLFGIPWRRTDSLAPLGTITLATYIGLWDAIPPGVLARHGTSPLWPVQIPDLIGVEKRKYLDRTGLVRHRNIADLMRYAALNQAADLLTRYGDFVPAGSDLQAMSPAVKERFSDEQLYALAKYVYSLQPPPNPYLPDTDEERSVVARGKGVFERIGCGRCHLKPLYTNNRLTPVDGFAVPAAHFGKYEMIEYSVGTDPGLSLETRRGTGYYKIPSLQGVWYRGPFEHNGSVATLEDWFDPRRLQNDYVPTGWKGPPGKSTRAVPGHHFGLNLVPEERAALIAFLRTL